MADKPHELVAGILVERKSSFPTTSNIEPSASSRLRTLDLSAEILHAVGVESMVIAFIATPSLKGLRFTKPLRVRSDD